MFTVFYTVSEIFVHFEYLNYDNKMLTLPETLRSEVVLLDKSFSFPLLCLLCPMLTAASSVAPHLSLTSSYNAHVTLDT